MEGRGVVASGVAEKVDSWGDSWGDVSLGNICTEVGLGELFCGVFLVCGLVCLVGVVVTEGFCGLAAVVLLFTGILILP